MNYAWDTTLFSPIFCNCSHTGAIGKAVRFTKRAALITDESITPSFALKVGRTRRFVREQSLEFWKRPRKRQVVSLKYVDNHNCRISKQMPNILLVAVLGDTPIVTLEFTESDLLSDNEYSVNTIEKLRVLRIKLFIDDFGTSYSSLSCLQQFKVDKLRIDQSFVRDIGDNSEGMCIMRAIIQLGRTFQMTVIAEGVKTESQLRTLWRIQA